MDIVRQAAFAYGRWNRERKRRLAERVARAVGARRVLVVGVNPTTDGPVNNLIEDHLRASTGFVVGSGLTAPDVAWKRFVVADGRSLPFAEDAFDLVFSNAVVEHVGGETEQRRFVEECVRVARAWVITTPNRTFPIEAHEHTFGSHMRRSWRPSTSSVTRLLSPSDLEALFPVPTVIRGWPLVSPTIAAIGRRR